MIHKNMFSVFFISINGIVFIVYVCLFFQSKKLNVYVDYCANQIKAKAIFDEKKNEPAIDDFFQRCLASPWSRKLDLWTFLGKCLLYIFMFALPSIMLLILNDGCKDIRILAKFGHMGTKYDKFGPFLYQFFNTFWHIYVFYE